MKREKYTHIPQNVPLFDGMEEFIERPKGSALSPNPQPTHVDHVLWLRGTCWERKRQVAQVRKAARDWTRRPNFPNLARSLFLHFTWLRLS